MKNLVIRFNEESMLTIKPKKQSATICLIGRNFNSIINSYVDLNKDQLLEIKTYIEQILKEDYEF